MKCPKCGEDAEHIVLQEGKGDKVYKHVFWWLIVGCIFPAVGWVVAIVVFMYIASSSRKEAERCRKCKYRFQVLGNSIQDI